jgi:RNA polymerase sigma-70 factor, ECF subfamily
VSDGADELGTLMRRAQAGDQRAYAELLTETVRLLRPFLAGHLCRAGDVDDLLQEILLSVHRARDTYDGQRPYKPWAFAIARFRLQDYLRAHYADLRRHAAELAAASDFGAGAVTGSVSADESISGAVRQLPAKQATILRLMYQEGYTAKEVAGQLGMSESAVKVAAHRAYRALRGKAER